MKEILLLPLLGFILAAKAQTFKCDSNGKVVYQDSPCHKNQSLGLTQQRIENTEDLRRKAEENRARNAKERDEIQKNFRTIPRATPISSQTIPGLGITQALACRVAIADIMGHPPVIVVATHELQGITYLRYLRPSDNAEWKNRCRIEGNRVIWATETGRWRTHQQDGVITVEADQKTVSIRTVHSDQSSSFKSYSRMYLD